MGEGREKKKEREKGRHGISTRKKLRFDPNKPFNKPFETHFSPKVPSVTSNKGSIAAELNVGGVLVGVRMAVTASIVL